MAQILHRAHNERDDPASATQHSLESLRTLSRWNSITRRRWPSGGSAIDSHRDAGSSQQFHVFASRCYFVKRHIDLLCDPDPVEQDGKFPCDGHHGSSSCMTSTMGTEAETPLSQSRGCAMWPDDMILNVSSRCLPRR
jgi:hypothetical protein